MRKLSRTSLAVLVLCAAAALFAAGPVAAAPAQDHDAHGQAAPANADEHAAPTQAPVDEHAAPAHGEEAAHGAADAHGETGGHGGSIPHLINLVSVIAPLLPEGMAAQAEAFVDPIFSLLVVLLLTVFFIVLARKLSARNPGRTQMAVELLFGGLYGLFHTIIGPSARRYTPFLGTLFLFILGNNLIGMFPLGHSSTAVFNTTTFALGLLTFLYVQGIALKENGLLGYLHHMAGSPKTGMDWGFSLLLFPLHLLGELIKPVSLSLRLFGNIFGEHTLVATMVLLGGGVIFGLTGSDYVPGLPLQFPFYFLGLLSSTIQALVFTLLATVYIALWLPHGDHAEEHGH